MTRAKIVTFEGPDGVGKTTQAIRLCQALDKEGKRAAYVKLPRYERLTGKLILCMLKSGSAVRYPNVFQVVQWLDKLIFQIFVLPKLMRENDFLIFDRWHVSMWAYGLAGGANETLTNTLVGSLRDPDLVLVFAGRSKRDEKQDAYESDAAYQKKVALHYVLWTCTHEGVATVNADEPIDHVSRSVLGRVHAL